MKDWWKSLESRERLFVGGLAVFLGVFLAYVLAESLFAGAANYREKAATAERDLAWMQTVAPRLQTDSRPQTGCGSGTLTVIVDRTRRRYEINTDNTQQVGRDGLRVKLDDTPFDSIMSWLGDLRSQCIEIEAANIQQSGPAGATDANFTLRRAQP